jgi:hypothetical protein
MAIAKHFGNSSISHNILNPTLFNFEIFGLENGILAPRLGDIWIIGSQETKQHYVKFDLLGMESMFTIKDKVVRVEHSRTISRMLSWSLDEKIVWVKDNLEIIDFALDFDQEGAISSLYMQ